MSIITAMAALEENEQKRVKEKVLITWNALSRPFKKYSKEFYVTIISAGALFGLILFMIDCILPVFLLVAVFFLFYVLNNTQPEMLTYEITNFGIKVSGSLTPWSRFGRFWFIKRFDSELLVVEVANIAGRMEIVIDKPKSAEIKKVLEEYLVFEESSPSAFDKAADWVGNKVLQQSS